MWPRKNPQFEQSNTVHGDGREEERFIKVDRVVRQIDKESGEMKIMMRDKGIGDQLNHIQNHGEEYVANNIGINEKIVIDPKRRRVDEEISGETTGAGNMRLNKIMTPKTCKWRVLGSRPA